MEKARSMLHYKDVSTTWWTEVVSTAVHLINRSTNSSHPTRTPFELTYKKKPSLNHLRVFGSIGYSHIDMSKRIKLEPKRFKCMFIGVHRRFEELTSVRRGVEPSEGIEIGEVGRTRSKREDSPTTIEVSTDAEESVEAQLAQLPVGDVTRRAN
ncbi:hypothetical protein PHPALM_30362 [Phytophthora palmivora]|uniref:Polyprotein n=1 Tax=Phytophthora palmivora TaxID=4796 RepID=A0A2P4X5B6_9STRA|nr:hypothetical protein PHPALM_30362 [Phytophthora palmivora]